MTDGNANRSFASAAAINPPAAETPSREAAQQGAAPMPPTGGDSHGATEPPGPDCTQLHRAHCPPHATGYGTNRLVHNKVLLIKR